jgi:hypothetical protein
MKREEAIAALLDCESIWPSGFEARMQFISMLQHEGYTSDQAIVICSEALADSLYKAMKDKRKKV